MTTRAPVVLILGAGSGVDLEMPVGSKLQETIHDLTKISLTDEGFVRYRWADQQIHAAVRQLYPKNMDEAATAIKLIHEGVYLRASIDDYLDRYRSNDLVNVCGKLAIARSILVHEARSSLHFNTENIHNTLDFNKIRNSWLIRFWQMLASGTATEDIANSLDHITIINFNYDRCIEYFLIQALRSLDRWTEIQAHDFVYNKMRIYHPYGTLGRLPAGSHHGGVAFGAKEVDLVPLGKNIKTYTERIEENDMLNKMRQAMAEAHTLIILGFHFHLQNVALLKPNADTNFRRVYATSKGISDYEQGYVRNQIGSWFQQINHMSNPPIELVRGDCRQLFNDYEKTLKL